MSNNHTIDANASHRVNLKTLLIWIVIILPSALIANHSHACNEANDAAPIATLFLKVGESRCTPSSRLDMDVKMSITGTIARVKVEQRFRNPSSDWVEGIYVFPLPDDAAVDHMRLIIGERIIEGEIQEKRQAKATYNKAKRAGKKASLLSQQRPDMFTTAVANIGPGEEVTVAIEYQQSVRLNQGEFSLRFPMTITPRYIPGHALSDDDGAPLKTGGGWSADTSTVPDASEITPPFGAQGENLHPVAISVDLQPGFPLKALKSAYHPVEQLPLEDSRYHIHLAPERHRANADFVLTWRAKTNSAPYTSLFRQQTDDADYGLLMITPPEKTTDDAETRYQARDLVFVIDTSGSMGGESIRQAKKALMMVINRLHPDDRFNLIEFNSNFYSLFDKARPASGLSKNRALSFVRSLQARGGTNMYPALERALMYSEESESGRVRQVVFLTDGAVGNETRLFELINRELGISRLFTIGIGSAPNSYFMRKTAEFGRGTFTHIDGIEEISDKMSSLFSKLESPVLTDIKLDLPVDTIIEGYPQPIPDLYLGEPIVVAIKANKLPDSIGVSGKLGQEDWHISHNLKNGEDRSGISVLWARRKIGQLMDSSALSRNTAEKDRLRESITQVALEHHLVSAYTSLVAVDKTPSRPIDENLKQQQLKNTPPKGTQFGLPKGATAGELQLITGLICVLLALLWIKFVGANSFAHRPRLCE